MGGRPIDAFLWPNKLLLEIHGFWPTDSDKHAIIFQHFIFIRIVLSFLGVLSFLVPHVLKVIVCWGDITILTGVGCIALTNIQHIFKMIYVLVRRRSFRKIYLQARELWSATNDHALERRGLEKLANVCKIFSIGFFLLCFSNNISFTTAAIVVWVNRRDDQTDSPQERIMPFNVWYGFDFQRTPYYEMAFCLNSVGAFYCCTGIVGFDTSLMCLIIHVCGHFRVIREKLRTIGRKIEEDEALYSKPDEIGATVLTRIEIGRIIEHHCRMLRMAEEVRNLLSPIIFTQLLTSGLEICLSGYAVIVGGSRPTDIFKFTCYLLSMFAQLMIWCWPGQLLIQDSQALGDVVCYEMPWYLLPPDQQRDLSFVIMRSQKECQITALGFQVMSMSKFTEVFNTAGSYLALLRQAYDKQMEGR